MLTTEIRGHQPPNPRYYPTARAEAKDRPKTLRIGIDNYLTKPFDLE
ncbi:MAG: response regulator [Bacteroidetes bacterium]|nr:MAG: response regulator [Bacteroidota bacterium]